MKRPGRTLALVLFAAAAPPLSCTPAAAPTNVPASASTTVISLQGIDCESCAARVIDVLEADLGFYAASFDRVRAELTVHYDAAQATPADFIAAIGRLGYLGIEGPGKGAYIPAVELAPDLDVARIAEPGQAVDLRDHVVPGKVTVFDFYAVWCGPCRELDEHMAQVLADDPDVALRKIDIVDWDSEAAKQHLRRAPDLPYVVVFGRSGKQVAAISGLALDELDAAIEKARRK